MNCQEFWDSIPEAGNVSGEAQLTHLENCGGCRTHLEAQRGLLRGMKNLAAESRRLGAPARVEARLLAAYRGHTGTMERPRRSWIPVLTWAAAAVVLAAIGLFLMSGRPPAEPAQRNAPHRMELATAQPSVVTLASYQGEFVPLPNADEIAPDEEVNLVRLELPRTAILALGLPVASDGLPDSVQADFVLGADGRPRAVRFVEE